jgi:hypothetical protein
MERLADMSFRRLLILIRVNRLKARSRGGLSTEERVRWQDIIAAANRVGSINNAEAEKLFKAVHVQGSKRKKYKRKKSYAKRRRY